MKTREELNENGFGDVLIIDQDFTIPAIIGVDAYRRAIYDYDKLVECFMEGEHWPEDEAIEWIDYNVIGTHYSDGSEPIIMTNNFSNL